jgi:excisionase family DNA binding protein
VIALLTPQQVSDYLGRSEQWVTAACRSGLLPARKVGRVWRVTEDDLTAFLDRVRTGQATAAPTTRRRRRSAA